MTLKHKLLLSKKQYPEYFSRDEFEDTTEFLLLLEELKANFEGQISLFFDIETVSICFDYEFIVEYEEIYQLIQALKNNIIVEYDLYFSEQGAEYHLIHKVKNNEIYVYIKRKNQKLLFLENLSTKEYIKTWEKIFEDICIFIQKELSEHANNSVLFEYINNRHIEDIYYPNIAKNTLKD